MRRDYLHINQHEKRYKRTRSRHNKQREWDRIPPTPAPAWPSLIYPACLPAAAAGHAKWSQAQMGSMRCPPPPPLSSSGSLWRNVAHLWLLSKGLCSVLANFRCFTARKRKWSRTWRCASKDSLNTQIERGRERERARTLCGHARNSLVCVFVRFVDLLKITTLFIYLTKVNTDDGNDGDCLTFNWKISPLNVVISL